MKRAVCIWLPNWPLQRLAAARAELSDRAIVLYELHASGGAKVVAYSPRLATAGCHPLECHADIGIRPGMPLAEALALAATSRRLSPALWGASVLGMHLEPADPAADRVALDELAEWCRQFSPSVGVEESSAPESLLLDATGLAPLFGGEDAFARHIVRAFHDRGLAARVAIAETLGAAWAIAHFAISRQSRSARGAGEEWRVRAPLIVPSECTRSALAPLPPAALRLPAEICALLAELGVRRIDELAALRRETLLARFGPVVLERLDQAYGAAPEAIVARPLPAEWSYQWLFAHPTQRGEAIQAALDRLLGQACGDLARTRQGLLRLACRFEPEHGRPLEFTVGFYRPTACPRHVGEVARLKLERLSFREPLAAIRVHVPAFDRLEFRQREFFAPQLERESPRELAVLVDRLASRLGSHAVVRPWLLPEAQPEFACQDQPLSSCPASRSRARPKKKTTPQASASQPPSSAAPPGDRPLHLERRPRELAVLAVAPEGPPVKFECAGRDRRIARCWGPERIETGWWRGRSVRRDYYQVETTDGARYWLFRELHTGRWFWHGTFA